MVIVNDHEVFQMKLSEPDEADEDFDIEEKSYYGY